MLRELTGFGPRSNEAASLRSARMLRELIGYGSRSYEAALGTLHGVQGVSDLQYGFEPWTHCLLYTLVIKQVMMSWTTSMTDHMDVMIIMVDQD